MAGLKLVITQGEIFAAPIGRFTKDMDGVKTDLEGINGKITKIETNVDFVKGTVVKIEIEHGQKLGALADGYKSNAEKLDRIEKEVCRRKEIILKKVL